MMDSIEEGRAMERERIIKVLQERFFDVPGPYCCGCSTDLKDAENWAIELIRDPNRNITSEILPDGSIYIEEIEGETLEKEILGGENK